MIILLGPQRFRPTVADAMRSVAVRGPVAMITAGWQEREGEDEELRAHLGLEAINLRLYGRCESIFAEDPELFAGRRAKQDRLRNLQEGYRSRLDHYLGAVRDLAELDGDRADFGPEIEDAVETVRRLDAHHLARIEAVHAEFDRRFEPRRRDAVVRHRGEIAASLEGADAVTVAGGHVAVLLNRLRLLEVASLLQGRQVIAWSAGAMVLAARVVVFHDRPPQGAGNAEVFDTGLGLCPGLVPLPHARRRLRLDDRARIAGFARRFAPALCATLDDGSRLDWQGREPEAASGVSRLAGDGRVVAVAP
jgi:hypothetical protein